MSIDLLSARTEKTDGASRATFNGCSAEKL